MCRRTAAAIQREAGNFQTRDEQAGQAKRSNQAEAFARQGNRLIAQGCDDADIVIAKRAPEVFEFRLE